MTAQFSQFEYPQFTDLIKRTFYKTNETYDHIMLNSSVVKTIAFPKNNGTSVRFAEVVDMTQYAFRTTEGQPFTPLKSQYGYEKDAQIYQIGGIFAITKLERDGAKDYLDTIGSALRQFITAVPNKRELDLSHRLTFAFVSSYVDNSNVTVDTTCGDGFPLLYNAHQLKGSPKTYNTNPTNGAFSKGELEVMYNSFANDSFNNLGERVEVTPDLIIIGNNRTLENRVDELTKATADVNSPNPATFNVFRGIRKLVNPRLYTDAYGSTDLRKQNMWFLASTQWNGIMYAELQSPMVSTPADGNNGEDPNTLNWQWTGYASCAISTPSAKWIRGSSGTDSPLTF